MATGYWTPTNYDLNSTTERLFMLLHDRITEINSQIKHTSNAPDYITYSHPDMKGGFVRITARKNGLNIKLAIIRINEIDDPKNLCEDNLIYRQKWSRAGTEVKFNPGDDFDYVTSLMEQAFEACLRNDKGEEWVRHLEQAHVQLAQEVDDHFEGKRYAISVNAYERDVKARTKSIACHGCYCAVCGFDFEATYGDVGKGVIEVHHITPLSQINQEYEVNPAKDLIPVCSNCHTIIHKRKPPYGINEARRLLK